MSGIKTKPFANEAELTRKNCVYCAFGHLHQQRPAYGKMCGRCRKTNQLRAVCRSSNGKRGTSHKVAQEATKENHIDLVNVNSFSFNNRQSVLVTKLKTSTSQNSAVIPYICDTGKDGNIMPIHIFRILFPRVMKENWQPQK